jgi:tetratricopeptide (TPR) repeat protein
LSEESPTDKFNHRVALHGLGGVGKTQCALEYVYANQDSYQRVYWISAVNRASLLSGYQKIADKSQLPGRQGVSTEAKAEEVLSWLKRQKNWLVVLDNLDDIKVAKGLLPENGPEKHTIITTRNPRTTEIPAEPLEVPLLSDVHSVALLSALSRIHIQEGSQDEKQAFEIAKELGNLPLAIDLAACYIRDIAGGLSEYSKRYKSNREKLHRWVPEGNRPYTDSVATAWSLSFDLIQKDQNATFLLHLFSGLNPDKILIEFLIAGIKTLRNKSGNGITDEHDLSIALLELEKYSIIKWDRRNQSISVHRLVQSVIRDKMSEKELISTDTAVVELCLDVFPRAINNNSRPLCRKYENQVVQPLLRINAMLSEELADIKDLVGGFLQNDGKYADSAVFLGQALKIRIAMFGDEDPVTLATMNTLALTYKQQGFSIKAAVLGEEVLEKMRRIVGEEHPGTLTTMHNLASIYQQQGFSIKAAVLGEEVLEKKRRVLGEEHPDTLATTNNLASTYWQQGFSIKAAALGEEVLEKRRRIVGEEHPDTLATMNNLASTYKQQGFSIKAAVLGEEVLEKRRRIVGEEHPDTLTTMHNLASIYQQQGFSIKAAALGEEVLEKRRRILGEEHPDTLTTMHNLASIYQQQGFSTKAAALGEEVLEKRRKILGEEHPDTFLTMHNLALTYFLQGRPKDSCELQEHVWKKAQDILPEAHPRTLLYMRVLAVMYRTQGRTDEARELEEEADAREATRRLADAPTMGPT